MKAYEVFKWAVAIVLTGATGVAWASGASLPIVAALGIAAIAAWVWV